MEKQTQSLKFLKQRKFYTLLPVLVLPFITLMFWAFGGGKANRMIPVLESQGLNTRLPEAYLEEKYLDKMSYYNKAQADSAKLEQMIKNDPYYRISNKKDSEAELEIKKSHDKINFSASNKKDGKAIPIEIKVNQKLQELNATLDNTLTKAGSKSGKKSTHPISEDSENSAEIERLEKMMLSMNQMDYVDQTEEVDPEMQQLNSMLEKILDIQHPDRVQEKIRQASIENKGQVFEVSPVSVNPVSLIDNRPFHPFRTDSSSASFTSSSNGFYSLDNASEFSSSSNTIRAVVHETQTLVNGSTIKMRLLNDLYINGILIPKDNFIFGTVALDGERLHVNIGNILFKDHLLPVSLSVYDLDGISGIYIPGAIERDVGKQSANRMVQSLNMNTLDTSFGSQVTSAGIEAAKSLFNKKVTLIKVTVKAGYQVILQDEKHLQDL